MVIKKNQRQDTLVNMTLSCNIASNGIYLEKLGHFVPNLSQSNSSLGPSYAKGIKAKTGAIGKLYRWPYPSNVPWVSRDQLLRILIYIKAMTGAQGIFCRRFHGFALFTCSLCVSSTSHHILKCWAS